MSLSVQEEKKKQKEKHIFTLLNITSHYHKLSLCMVSHLEQQVNPDNSLLYSI